MSPIQSIPASGRSSEEEAGIARDFYFGDSYFDRRQLISMTAQLAEVHRLRPRRVLEIGKGNGFVSDFLRKAGYDVVTADINPSLEPDVVTDILRLEDHFGEGAFDLTFCAEVLEHLPFESFPEAVRQIARTTSRHALLTIPRAQRILLDFQCLLTLPRMRQKAFGIFLALPRGRVWPGHQWEIDSSAATSRAAVRGVLEEWFEVRSFRRERFKPYHQFITLKKRTPGAEPLRTP